MEKSGAKVGLLLWLVNGNNNGNNIHTMWKSGMGTTNCCQMYAQEAFVMPRQQRDHAPFILPPLSQLSPN